MDLGLAVSQATLGGGADSAVLLEAAAAAGVTARLMDWRGPGWDWADAVLLHTPWDYTEDPRAFAGWLQSMSGSTPVFNPYASIAGNMHKSYLLDLAADGVPLPLTRLLPAGRPVGIEELAAVFGGSEVVVKPAVGAGGRGLCRLAGVAHLHECPLVGTDGVPAEDLLVQAFVPSIQSGGEHSLVVIAGEPSHLVRKVAAAGEFRVQATYGGTERRVELDATAAEVAAALRSRTAGLAYARIDYVLGEDSGPLVMELELTEPDLFLRHAPEAATRLVEHVAGVGH